MSDEHTGNPLVAMGLLFTSILVVAIGIWVFFSAMEAHAFNRATGKDVSTWDAMWISLRVMEPAK